MWSPEKNIWYWCINLHMWPCPKFQTSSELILDIHFPVIYLSKAQVHWSKLYSASSYHHHFDGLVHDCSNSSALALELLQSCTKPLICSVIWTSSLRKSTCPIKIILPFICNSKTLTKATTDKAPFTIFCSNNIIIQAENKRNYGGL